MIPSFVISIALGFAFGAAAGWVYVVAMVSALLYDLYLKRTPFSIVSLIVSFGLLPVFVALGSPVSHYAAAWMIAAGALLGATIHFLNVIPDFADDAKTGVKGFVHYFSYEHALFLGALLLAFSAGSVLFGIHSKIHALGWILFASFAAVATHFVAMYSRGDMKHAFTSSKLLTLVTVVVLLFAAQYM